MVTHAAVLTEIQWQRKRRFETLWHWLKTCLCMKRDSLFIDKEVGMGWVGGYTLQ